MSEANLRLKRSFTYLLPELANYIKIDKDKIKNLFLGIKGKSKSFNGTVVLLVEDNNESYKHNGYWLSSIKVEEGYLIEYMYPEPDLYKLFIQGRYSEFEREWKERIIKYFNLDAEHKAFRILYRHEKLKQELEEKLGVTLTNQELGERIKFDEEVYE